MLICGALSPIKPIEPIAAIGSKRARSSRLRIFFEPNPGKLRTSFLESTAVLIAGQRTG
jgi:hypothetical protein